MTAALHSLTLPLLGASSKSSSSSSSYTFLILIVIAAAFYFFIFRPQQRKNRAARDQQNKFDVGDEVLTAGGIVGHVIDIQDDRVTIETSVGASFVVLKQYVIRRLSSGPEVDDEEFGHDHDEIGSGHDDGNEDGGDDGVYGDDGDHGSSAAR